MIDGSLRKCTGFPVLYNPVTTYSAEWYERNVVEVFRLNRPIAVR